MARTLAAAIALLLFLPAVALVAGPAPGQIPHDVEFSSIRDYPVDSDGSGLFNELVVDMKLDVTREGSYTIGSVLSVNASGNNYVIGTRLTTAWLTVGDNSVSLSFPSEDIFDTGRSGNFQVDIEVQHYNSTEKSAITHLTRLYDHNMFQAPDNPPPVPPDAPDVEEGEDGVEIVTVDFEASVSLSSPEVTFRYRDTDPAMPDFVLTYHRLILFNDDEGDGRYGGEDPVANVILASHPWELGPIERNGPAVSFEMSALVPVPVDGGFVSANMTLVYTITNGALPEPTLSGFIRGDASELKVDVLFEPEEGIPGADHLAFEFRIRDTEGEYDFLVEEPVGFVRYSRSEDTGYLPVPLLPRSSNTKVGLVNDNMVMHAFVGWQNLARKSWFDESEPAWVDVSGSFRVSDGTMEIYNAYKFEDDLATLDHDPSLGTVVENRPPEQPVTPPGEEPTPNPYVFWFAFIVGAVIILITLYARAQGY